MCACERRKLRMKIAVGSDSAQHIGEVVVAHLRGKGIDVLPCGALAGEKADYVDSGRAVAEKVAAGECDLGILLCNTGTGASREKRWNRVVGTIWEPTKYLK